ncbi:MAG: hypothetical protein H7844_08730 [Nitrospirae bacterium YQR-1]
MKTKILIIVSQILMVIGDYMALSFIFAHYVFRAKPPNVLKYGPISGWFVIAAIVLLFVIFYFILSVKKIKKKHSIIICFSLSLYCPVMIALMSLSGRHEKALYDYISLIFSPAGIPSMLFAIAGLLLSLVPSEELGKDVNTRLLSKE